MPGMEKILHTLCIAALLGLSFIVYKNYYKQKIYPDEQGAISVSDLENNLNNVYRLKAKTLKHYVSKHTMNTSICFLIDMKIPSNLFRFYVYDLNKDSILYKGLAANGKYDEQTLQVKYSNAIGSRCTSLGRYQVGYKYNGDYGITYKLYGLDSTNSNAFERNVVLHSYRYIPDNETNNLISLSNGCPMVSENFLQTVSAIIDTAKKPIALEIFDK